MTEHTLLEVIADRSKDFTEAQQRIAQYVVRNPMRVAFMNARELADAAGVSESSVIRFAYSAGFTGYREFQVAAQQLVNSKLSMDERYRSRPRDVDDVVQETVRCGMRGLDNLGHTLSTSDVELAADRLATARKCYVAGYRGSAGLALIASSTLSQVGRCCIQLSLEAGETVDMLMDMGEQDALLAIAYRRYARRTLDIARFARGRGAFVVAITDSAFSPIREFADVMLVGGIEAAHSSYSLLAPVCIVDSLVLAISKRLGDEAVASIERWEDTYGFFDLLAPDRSTGKED